MRILTLLLLLLISFQGISQNLEWAKSMGNSSFETAYSIASDRAGNIYATGRFTDTLDFDPGPNTAMANSQSTPQSDIFIVKFSANGVFLWVKTIGNSKPDEGNSILIDNNNDIYITGFFGDTVDFDPGIGTTNLIASGNGTSSFILKLNDDGDLIWAKSFGNVGTTGSTESITSTLDVNNNLLITGKFTKTVDYDPGPGAFNLTSTGGATPNTFILKLNSNGDFLWAKSINGTSENRPKTITTDSEGNVFTSGIYVNSTDFDPGTGAYNFTSQVSQQDVFIQKLDSNGIFSWAISQGGITYLDRVNKITTDKNDNLLLTGSFSGIVDFDPSNSVQNLDHTNGNGFIQKLDNSGNLLWVNNLPGHGTFVSTNTLNNIYLTGQYSGNSNFSGVTLIDHGLGDVYILKLDSLGSFLTISSLNGPGYIAPRCFNADSNDKVLIGGDFHDSLYVNNNTQTVVNSIGNDWTTCDIFICKLNSNIGLNIIKNKMNKYILQLYPNPSSSKLSFSNKNLNQKKIEILTITGEFITTLNPKEHSFDISDLKAGTYLLRLSFDNQIITEKFIKQ